MTREGKQYKVIQRNPFVTVGSILEVVEDDSSNFPWFKLVIGSMTKQCSWDSQFFALALVWLEEYNP